MPAHLPGILLRLSTIPYFASLMRQLLSITMVLFAALTCRAGSYIYDFDTHCRNAYTHYMALHLNEGRSEIQEALRENPRNLMAVYVEDYEDCLLLLLNGNKADYRLKEGNYDRRLELLSKGDENDPWYRLCKAGIYLHWALVHIRFEDNVKAAFQFRKSFILLKENKRLFPDFEYNDIYLGTEQAVAGAMPEKYKWIASLFGIKGDVRKGTALITNFVSRHSYNDLFKYEAAVFASYLRLYMLYEQDEVWAFLNSSDFPAKNNLLLSFVKANIALNTRRAEQALQTMRSVQSDPYYNIFPMTHYEMGSAYFYKVEPESITHLQQFVNKYKGHMFVKDALQKIALMHFLQRDNAKANAFRAKIPSHGNSIADVDIQAQRFSKESRWPNFVLLYAHLLIDGGYHKIALDKLDNFKEADFPDIADKLEYNFRLARAYDEMSEENKAVQLYQRTINLGRDRKEHFAARAALQMAYVYERVGKKQEAIKRFREALSMRGHDFQGAIDQQAKAGLNRLGAS